MIVCKKTDQWYIEWHRMTASDNEWERVVQRMTRSSTTSGIEWYNKWQGMKRLTVSGIASDNEWQRMTTSNKNWQWVTSNDSESQNEWIRVRVSKIEWFYVSKETKSQYGRPIRFLNGFIQFSVQYINTTRTSRSVMFFEIGKHLCWSLFFVKFQAWRHINLLKRDCNRDVFLWILRSFSENFI